MLSAGIGIIPIVFVPNTCSIIFFTGCLGSHVFYSLTTHSFFDIIKLRRRNKAFYFML